MLTFSTQDILINWPSYSSPAGLKGYQQRAGDWSVNHIFGSLKRLRDCNKAQCLKEERNHICSRERGM